MNLVMNNVPMLTLIKESGDEHPNANLVLPPTRINLELEDEAHFLGFVFDRKLSSKVKVVVV